MTTVPSSPPSFFGRTRPFTRPLRAEHSDRLFFVTNRTISEEFWLAPLVASLTLPRSRRERLALRTYEARTRTQLVRWLASGAVRRGRYQPAFSLDQAVRVLRDLVGSLLARAQRRYGVEIFAVCVMSNHFHLVVRSKSKRIAAFMRDFKSQLARSLNSLFGRSGPLWGRRYDCQPILDDPSSLDRVLYTLDNPMKARLATSLGEWPGLALAAGLSPEEATFEYFDKTAWHAARRPRELAPFFERATLRLSPLPMMERAPSSEIARELRRHLNERRRNRAAHDDGTPALDLVSLAQVRLGSKPAVSAKRRRPLCFTVSPRLRNAYVRERRSVHRAYAMSSDRLRTLAMDVRFPEGTYRSPVALLEAA